MHHVLAGALPKTVSEPGYGVAVTKDFVAIVTLEGEGAHDYDCFIHVVDKSTFTVVRSMAANCGETISRVGTLNNVYHYYDVYNLETGTIAKRSFLPRYREHLWDVQLYKDFVLVWESFAGTTFVELLHKETSLFMKYVDFNAMFGPLLMRNYVVMIDHEQDDGGYHGSEREQMVQYMNRSDKQGAGALRRKFETDTSIGGVLKTMQDPRIAGLGREAGRTIASFLEPVGYTFLVTFYRYDEAHVVEDATIKLNLPEKKTGIRSAA